MVDAAVPDEVDDDLHLNLKWGWVRILCLYDAMARQEE